MTTIERAVEAHAPSIAGVLAANLTDPSLFQRDVYDVRRRLADFLVARDGANIVGCAAIHFHSARSAEVLSVAVDPARHGHGIGGALLREALVIARDRGAAQVWLGTRKPDYFRRFGFERCWRWRVLLAPPSVLVDKIRAVFAQPRKRWLAALLGGHIFMRRSP
jgi:amino-acid N-acetyltransferase